jgi:hypothetical protein
MAGGTKVEQKIGTKSELLNIPEATLPEPVPEGISLEESTKVQCSRVSK